MTATLTDINLHTPMYFFLINLSSLDICYSSAIVPRMLRDLLSANHYISFKECVIQMYICLSLGEAECILLAIMAYDRYVAICYPLHYTTIIKRSKCIKLATSTWVCGFVLSIAPVAVTSNIKFCGKYKINHFICEIPGMLSLGCGNIAVVEFTAFVSGVIMLMIPVTFIFITYVKINRAILKITTVVGQKKAFYTCGSHIMVVTLFYGSAMATYMTPRSSTSPESVKIIAIFYTIIAPVLNPVIYTLRNKEVKKALQKIKIKKTYM
ncbi:putative olfactory receptor 2B8 [Discoglossus pictus]